MDIDLGLNLFTRLPVCNFESVLDWCMDGILVGGIEYLKMICYEMK